jgi:hypothetical protein
LEATVAAERPDYDQALKALLTRSHDGVLALVAPDLAFVAERPTELPVVRREADLVWEVVNPGGERCTILYDYGSRPRRSFWIVRSRRCGRSRP